MSRKITRESPFKQYDQVLVDGHATARPDGVNYYILRLLQPWDDYGPWGAVVVEATPDGTIWRVEQHDIEAIGVLPHGTPINPLVLDMSALHSGDGDGLSWVEPDDEYDEIPALEAPNGNDLFEHEPSDNEER